MPFKDQFHKYCFKPVKTAAFSYVTLGTWLGYAARTFFNAVSSLEYFEHKATDLELSYVNNTALLLNCSTSGLGATSNYSSNDTDPSILYPALLLAAGTLGTVMIGRTHDLKNLFFGEKQSHLSSEQKKVQAFIGDETNTNYKISYARRYFADFASFSIKSIGVFNLIPTGIYSYLGLMTTFEKCESLCGVQQYPTINQVGSLMLTAAFVTQAAAFGRKRAFENADECRMLIKQLQFTLESGKTCRTIWVAGPNVFATFLFGYYGANAAIPKLPTLLQKQLESAAAENTFIWSSVLLALLNALVTYVPSIYKHKASSIQIPDYESPTLLKFSCGLMRNPLIVTRNIGYAAGAGDALGSGFCGNIKALAYTLYKSYGVPPYQSWLLVTGVLLGLSGGFTTWSYAVINGLRKVTCALEAGKDKVHCLPAVPLEQDLREYLGTFISTANDDLYYVTNKRADGSLVDEGAGPTISAALITEDTSFIDLVHQRKQRYPNARQLLFDRPPPRQSLISVATISPSEDYVPLSGGEEYPQTAVQIATIKSHSPATPSDSSDQSSPSSDTPPNRNTSPYSSGFTFLNASPRVNQLIRVNTEDKLTSTSGDYASLRNGI